MRKKNQKKKLTEEKKRLIVSFEFDAVVACSVTTFFGATEIPKEGNRIVQGVQQIGERIYYPQKSQFNQPHMFPPQDNPFVQQHQLNLDLFNTQSLSPNMNDSDGGLARKDTFPIIIRLECVAENKNEDEGNASQHTLQELRPGESLPKWLQAQTTYAVLRRDDQNSKWQVQVVKQKIWVSGSAYVLQDLYGIEGGVSQTNSNTQQNHNQSLNDQSDDLDSGRECVICLTAPRDTAVLPCRHFCMCQDCAKEVYKTSRQCPICRIKAASLLQIKMENKQKQNLGGEGQQGGSRIVQEGGEVKVDVEEVGKDMDEDGFVMV
eukprot:TRINITY_DN35193_c0_g1_i2.p2 TRINITY_DN35193_c0_g1~~TRINITY_DN35193_c0_g1_i2.p2  ORF type:complete len:320 (-),score=51.04 TRINITY_DN35193_c0_g1_i2:318-1277(-)